MQLGTQKGMRQHGQQPTKQRMPAIAHAKQPGCVTLQGKDGDAVRARQRRG